MATPFHLELVTPERILFSGETDEVSLRSDGGEIAFLAKHEDFIGAVDITMVRIHAPAAQSGGGAGPSHDAVAEELRVAVHGGFVEVNESGVVILAGVAELAAEIDVDRAQRAVVAAEERLATEPQSTAPVDGHDGDEGHAPSGLMTGAMLALLASESAEAALRRARVRLEVAGARATT